MCTNSHRISEDAKINNKMLRIQQTYRIKQLNAKQSIFYSVSYYSHKILSVICLKESHNFRQYNGVPSAIGFYIVTLYCCGMCCDPDWFENW